MPWVLAGLWMWLSTATAAGGNCTPVYEVEFRELVDAQNKALLEGEDPDIAEHDRLSRELEARLPCADFRITSDHWARYLVGVALREYHRGGDWHKPLTTALRISPNVELPVREGHPLRAFVPVARPPSTGPVPPDIELYLDGLRLEQLVPLDAIHLLQRPNGDGWQTRVVLGPGGIPHEFLQKPQASKSVKQARRRAAIRAVGTVSAGLMLAGGGAAFGVGYSQHQRFHASDTAESELPRLQQNGPKLVNTGIGLLAAGGATALVVWVVPW